MVLTVRNEFIMAFAVVLVCLDTKDRHQLVILNVSSILIATPMRLVKTTIALTLVLALVDQMHTAELSVTVLFALADLDTLANQLLDVTKFQVS